jgi:antitoxin YefM
MTDWHSRTFCEGIIIDELVKSPTPSLRGAKRRGNLLNIRLDTRLLRFARNDKWGVFRLFAKASLLDQVTKNREVIIIQRHGEEDVAMISADELRDILETAHLLRSPNNVKRLLSSLDRVREESGTPQTIDELRTEVGLK